MKDKVLTLIIGILIGAIITAAGFFIYSNVNENDTDDNFRGGDMQEMDGNFTGGKGMQMDGNMTPGDKPDGEGGDAPSDAGDTSES